MQDTNYIELLDAFHEYLNNIYYEGYALWLLANDPANYDFHFEQFRECF